MENGERFDNGELRVENGERFDNGKLRVENGKWLWIMEN